MKLLLRKAGLIIAVAGSLCLMTTTTILAASQSEDRVYLRFGVAEQTLSGAFDENTSITFANSATTLVTPNTDPAQGYGFTFGSQSGHVCGELSYYRTEQDSLNRNAALSAIGKTISERVSYDVKIMLLDPGTIHISPYALIGGSYDAFEVKKGASNGATSGDAEYWGIGYKWGAGLLVRLNDSLGLEGSYTQSRTTLDHLKAFGTDSDREVKMASKVVTVSLNYYF
jgi:opacity protein-like surface antigen